MQSTQFAEAGGVRIAYDVTGSGQPVILLHAGIVDRGMWDDVVPLLADAFQVVRFDARGFGESSRPPDGSFARWDDLFAVMDAAGERWDAPASNKLHYLIAMTRRTFSPD